MAQDESHATYFYYAVALFGAAMTPYEVFFFSSGGVEEGWTEKDLKVMRSNVFIGFPLGGALSIAIAAVAAVTFLPQGIEVDSLGQIGLPVGLALGKIGIVLVLLGFFAATFGAACETGLSVGYSVAQYLGWQWGKFVEPLRAARFHTVLLLSTIVAVGVLLTTVDPIMLTEYSVVFSAVALPAAIGERLPGKLGTWTQAIWRRLHQEQSPQAVLVPIEHVRAVASSVELDEPAARGLAAAFGLELWLRRYVISRIPGAKGGGEPGRSEAGPDGPPPEHVDAEQARGAQPTRPPDPAGHWLSGLLGAQVVDDSGQRLGHVREVRCSTARERWVVTGLECTRSVMGTRLGYNVDPEQGPALIGRLVRHWERNDLLVPISEVTDLGDCAAAGPRVVSVTTKPGRPHPLAREPVQEHRGPTGTGGT